MRFVFINRFYWPDEPATAQLLTDLAEGLASSGISVSVLASHSGGIEPVYEVRHGVSIIRVRGTRSRRLGLIGKLTDFVTFYIGSLWAVVAHARKGDIVVPLTDPPLLGFGIWIAANVRRAKLIHWTQDIYPEIAITLTGQRWLNVLKPLRNLAWRRADGCVTLGRDMAGVHRLAGVRPECLTVMPNWAPAGLNGSSPKEADDLRAKWDLIGRFVVLYSGNLGRVHDLMPLLDVAERLRAEARVLFLFVGAGAQLPLLIAEVEARGLENVHFRPPQPRIHLASLLALGDLHLVSVRSGCESLVFPSKLYGIAAIGRPVLFLGPKDCEIATVVEQNRFGWAFTREQIGPMAQTIRELSIAPSKCAELGRAAAAFSVESGGAADAARRWAALAGSLAPA